MASTPPAHTKATRQDWIDAALSALDDVPIDQLRILSMAGDLSVSRSSFYWYFENLDELHAELLTIWDRNTDSIVERCERESAGAVASCLGVFECWADRRLYDPRLDLAVRDWGRRSPAVAERVAAADRTRLGSIAAMFDRHGFDPDESVVRARLLYHSQVGYYTLGTDEPLLERLTHLPYYLEAMAGATPTGQELAAFGAFLATLEDHGGPDD